jgi:hypothetical protein
MRAKTQPYSAYDYYNPEDRVNIQPVEMIVNEQGGA